MERGRNTARDEVRRTNRAAMQVCLMHACVLETAAWAGHVVAPHDVLAELAVELRVQQSTARGLQRQARMVRRASARLNLPEQIW